MVDPFLKAVADAADNGQSIPAIRVVAGNTLFVGQPGPASEFGQRTVRGMAEELYS
jgi:hypothetical protein